MNITFFLLETDVCQLRGKEYRLGETIDYNTSFCHKCKCDKSENVTAPSVSCESTHCPPPTQIFGSDTKYCYIDGNSDKCCPTQRCVVKDVEEKGLTFVEK